MTNSYFFSFCIPYHPSYRVSSMWCRSIAYAATRSLHSSLTTSIITNGCKKNVLTPLTAVLVHAKSIRIQQRLYSNTAITLPQFATRTPMTSSSIASGQRQMAYWLAGCSSMVFGMVVLGGVTRLTRSGLSMVHWKAFGGLPPITHEQWCQEFERYKQFPEYDKVHRDMSLESFKKIYMMEWSHRMFGRLIGVAFVVPLCVFTARGYVTRQLSIKLASLFALGGTQGFVGWWMVKSGLEPKQHSYELPRVSPYRLAVHLISAFSIYGFLVHTTMDLFAKSSAKPRVPNNVVPRAFRYSVAGVLGLVALTAFSGAFVAGNEAGLIYNEFPMMGGHWIPDDIINPNLPNIISNIFENSSLVQFEHRVLATTTLTAVVSLWTMSRFMAPKLPAQALLATNILLGVASMQVSLGIATLLMFVPVDLASAHQAGSLTLLTSAIWILHSIRRLPR